MELIKKKICLSDYTCRTNPYLINGLIPEDIIYDDKISHWGEITGVTSSGNIEYYSIENTGYTAELCSLNILFTQFIDDIGVLECLIENWIPNKSYYKGESILYNGITFKCLVSKSKSTIFNLLDWINNDNILNDEYIPILTDEGEFMYVDLEENSGNTINFIGESKVNEFRRYSKTTNDKDLYNPTWNTGFTQEIKNTYGNINKIISESIDHTGSKQNLYEYVLGATENDLEMTGIHYKDLDSWRSQISYNSNGFTSDNSISAPNIKQEYLLGIIEPPKINIDVLIDRGVNSTFDKNLKLGEIRSIEDLISYGNGFFKIKNN